MRTRFRRLLAVLAWCFCAWQTSAQPILLPSGDTPLQAVSLRTYAGPAPVTTGRIEPSPEVTVAILIESIDAPALDSLKKGLIKLYRSAGASRSLRIAILSGGSVQFAGPFASRPKLLSALAELSTVPPSQPSPAAQYEMLAGAASQLGSSWSSVLLAGNLPSLDAESAEYASALLIRRFTAARVRVSYWSPSGAATELVGVLCQVTGGGLVDGIDQFGDSLGRASQSFQELTWTDPAPAKGFHLYRATLLNATGGAIAQWPQLAAAIGGTAPAIESYATLRQQVGLLAALTQQKDLSTDQAQQFRTGLAQALAVNPRDARALRLGAGFYLRFKDYKTAANLLDLLAETDTLNSAVHAERGRAWFLGGDTTAAEKAYLRARELGGSSVTISEDLARIHLTRSDDAGALPFLEEVLRIDTQRQEIWFLRAASSEKIHDWNRAVDSFEHGLALGGDHIPETTALIRLYLEKQETAKALGHARTGAARLPADREVRATYAGFFDDLHSPDEALSAWKKTLEVDNGYEPAHYRIARLLLEKGDFAAALEASEQGISSNPKSPRLYLAKAEALERQNLVYQARETLRQAAASIDDAALLTRLAAFEDTFGAAAPAAYQKLASLLLQAAPKPAGADLALQRGLEVSLRENDTEHTTWFSGRLETEGNTSARKWLPAARDLNTSGTGVPGGLDALSFIAHGKPKTAPESFFTEYCRAVVQHTSTLDAKQNKAYAEAIQQHFQRIATLDGMGKRDGNRLILTLSLSDNKSKHRAEQILNVLGVKLRANKSEVTLQRGKKSSQAERQETTAALAVDEVGLLETLQAGKPFTLEITSDWARVYPNERIWRETFFPKEKLYGGFAEAVAHTPRLAKLYVGLSAVGEPAVEALFAGVGLKTLYNKYADPLSSYSSALAVQGKRVVVPGGAGAEAAWAQLVGANPAAPPGFFKALLEKDDGRILAFFFTLAQIDAAHQRFFTLSHTRLSRFYQLFAETAAPQIAAGHMTRDTGFIEFLRDIPLDGDGSVNFPGAAEIWMVAKGTTRSSSSTAKLLKKASRAAAPDEEDEVLIRMARTRYQNRGERHSELDNFIAVSRIDAHRATPLEGDAALNLAQHFGTTGAAYPYFTILTVLETRHFELFFSVLETLRTHDRLDANLALGELHGLIELLCLLRKQDLLSDENAAVIFRSLCERFLAARAPGDRAAASLDVLRQILAAGKNRRAEASPDEQWREWLAGSSAPVHFAIHGKLLSADPAKARTRDFQRVLELQKVPSLSDLLNLYEATRRLAAGQPAAEQIRVIEAAAARMPAVDLPKALKLTGKEKEYLRRFDPAALRKTAQQLHQKTSKQKANPKDLEKLAAEMLSHLQPQVTLAISGLIYAYHLAPEDLILSEDALLLRKHRYLEFTSGYGDAMMIAASRFVAGEGSTAGSHFAGGFAQFSKVAGAAGVYMKAGGAGTESTFGAQIGTLRDTSWKLLNEGDLRLLSLRIQVAREWVVQSAMRPDLFADLSESTLGLLSLARRADLLSGLTARSWKQVWETVTLSDLYFLGEGFLSRYPKDPWPSPLVQALRAAASRSDGSHLQMLGAVPVELFGCSHPHLQAGAPYEEYERYLMPDKIAERTAEFKIYLAYVADQAGVPAGALGQVAESLALTILRNAHMSDPHDWRSVITVFSAMDAKTVQEAFEKP